MWLIVALLMDEIVSKEEIADIHDELFFARGLLLVFLVVSTFCP